MPYVKISDPNTIDLAAWHQLINVVNQHSDSITAITNNFGAQGSGTTDWNGSYDLAHEYDPGSQKIIYGKTKVIIADANEIQGTGNIAHMYYGDISFVDEVSGSTAFNAKPIVTASVTFGSTDTPPPTNNANVVCTIINVRENVFTFRLTNARSTMENPVPLTGYFYITWTAIGPK